jgi:hypothetical protein
MTLFLMFFLFIFYKAAISFSLLTFSCCKSNNVCEFNSNTTFYDYVNFEEDILIDASKYFYFGTEIIAD